MTLLKLFYDSLVHYAETLRAFYLNLRQRLGYFLLLSIVCVLPILYPMTSALNLWENNRETIIQSIPDFTVENNQLKANDDTKPFINKTDMLVYAYDPNDQLSDEELTRSTPIGFYFKTGKTAFTLSVLGQTEHFPYDGRQGDSAAQRHFIRSVTTLPHPLIYLSAFLTVVITLLIAALLLSVVVSFMPLAIKLELNFGRKFNLALMAMTLPVVVIAILSIMMPALLLSSVPLIVLVGGFRLFYLSRHVRVVPLDPEKWQQAWKKLNPDDLKKIRNGQLSEEELKDLLNENHSKSQDDNHKDDNDS
ncbi:MAG: DUF1189 family protein [Aerococcus sp.]|nr:DUF1189 family protein [Aerococcus sp.]